MHGIGWAVKQLQDGHRVRRSGWNGKGMFIALMPALDVQPDMISEVTRKHTEGILPEGATLKTHAYIAMWTAQGTWQPGWVVSQADLLAVDWELAD